MAEDIRAVAWEEYEHHHEEKKSDWYWIAGILVVSVAVASIFLGNPLFGIMIIVGGFVLLLAVARPPRIVHFAITQRGIQIDERLYPYATLRAYFISEDEPFGPQLLVRSEKFFMPLLIIPIPEDYIDEIEAIIAQRLPEEHLEEPFARKLLELIGF